MQRSNAGRVMGYIQKHWRMDLEQLAACSQSPGAEAAEPLGKSSIAEGEIGGKEFAHRKDER
uniref:Uncharacterized protein n=1 Tax=uncultured Chlorobiota bacterium TaxID=156405 RepID=H5SGL5_9BACT|nr:hypothetical protein HGMM_F27B02C03 [uncultured Chlorobiota bacterium]